MTPIQNLGVTLILFGLGGFPAATGAVSDWISALTGHDLLIVIVVPAAASPLSSAAIRHPLGRPLLSPFRGLDG